MSITLSQAKNLKYHQVLHSPYFSNADGTPQRWRVNGKVKVWKRSPERVYVPLKYGLRVYTHIDENDLDLLCLTAEEAIAERERSEKPQDE